MAGILEEGITKDRVYGLDILRALAIVLVVAGHSLTLLPEQWIVVFKSLVFTDGVTLFFVLSGFFIGGILIRSAEREGVSGQMIVNFWIRRWFRTLPAYFLVLLLVLSLSFLFINDRPHLTAHVVFRYFIFSQNLFYPHPVFFTDAWSLSVEEWFYLLIPILLLLCVRPGKLSFKQSFLILAFSVLILTTLFRWYRYNHLTVTTIADWSLYFRKQVITRLDTLMFGLLGAYFSFYHHRQWIRYKNLLLFAGIALLAWMKIAYDDTHQFGLSICVFSFSINAFAVLLTLPFLSELRNGKGRIFQTVTFISLISYSMYLLNFSVFHRLFLRLTLHGMDNFTSGWFYVLRYAGYWICVVVGSAWLYKYFERPVIRLREKFRLS